MVSLAMSGALPTQQSPMHSVCWVQLHRHTHKRAPGTATRRTWVVAVAREGFAQTAAVTARPGGTPAGCGECGWRGRRGGGATPYSFAQPFKQLIQQSCICSPGTAVWLVGAPALT